LRGCEGPLYHKNELTVKEIGVMMGIPEPTCYAYVRETPRSRLLPRFRYKEVR